MARSTAAAEEMPPAVTPQMMAKKLREARENSLLSTLQTMRSQLELYKIQHNGRYPSMGQLTGWKALTKRTDANGKITANGPFGPYLRAAPTNPFTGMSAVQPARSKPSGAGWSWDAKRGKLRALMRPGFRMGKLRADDVETPRPIRRPRRHAD
jgi:hypothetical protein